MSSLAALSPEYHRGPRLNQVVNQTLSAFEDELSQDGNPIAALKRISEEDAVRILTIHKCKGLEFEKLIILGVEHELFWSPQADENRAEFFVAISRARSELILASTSSRPRLPGPDELESPSERAPRILGLRERAGVMSRQIAPTSFGESS